LNVWQTQSERRLLDLLGNKELDIISVWKEETIAPGDRITSTLRDDTEQSLLYLTEHDLNLDHFFFLDLFNS
jgi:hypothetical protein